MNQHFYVRQGVELPRDERIAARGWRSRLLRASLSAKGLKQTRDIMRLNHTLGELNDNDFEQYGEWQYHITVMGHAVRDRAVGLAVRRPSRDHQLLRAGRSGGDDAVLRRLRAGHRHVRQVQGHRRSCRTSRTAGSRWSARSTRRSARKAILEVSKTRQQQRRPRRSRTTSSLDYAGIRRHRADDAAARSSCST